MLGHASQREILLNLDLRIVVHRHEPTIRIEARRRVAMLMGKAQADVQQVGDQHDESGSTITLTEPVSLRRSGREMALLVGSTVAADRSDPTLVAKA